MVGEQGVEYPSLNHIVLAYSAYPESHQKSWPWHFAVSPNHCAGAVTRPGDHNETIALGELRREFQTNKIWCPVSGKEFEASALNVGFDPVKSDDLCISWSSCDAAYIHD
jgi:hypothetical protein